MNKMIFGSALACVLFLLIGTYKFPDTPVMWLAGTTAPYTFFRILAAISLVGVLFTNPPRKLGMRIFMGVVSLILVSVGAGIGISDSIHLLDMVLFILLGIAFAIEALEFNEEELETSVLELRKEYAQKTAMPSLALRDQVERTVRLATYSL